MCGNRPYITILLPVLLLIPLICICMREESNSLDGFTDICYTEETSKPVFRGKISSKYHKNYFTRRSGTGEEYFIDEFVIHDYFSPGAGAFFATTE